MADRNSIKRYGVTLKVKYLDREQKIKDWLYMTIHYTSTLKKNNIMTKYIKTIGMKTNEIPGFYAQFCLL